MLKKHFYKLILCSLLICSFSSILFAQSEELEQIDGSDIYSLIDIAFLDKSSDNVSAILSSCRSSPNYSEYEEYVLKKTRTLLLSNQIELVQLMALAVVDNNLDNTDAINLYMTVEKSIEKRAAKQKIVAEQRQAEADYVAQVSDKQKENIRKDYNVVESSDIDQGVFISQHTSKYYSDFTWSASMNLADIFLHVEQSEFNAKYGLAVSGDFYYHGAKVSVGTDIFADVSLLNFANSQKSLSEISIIPGVSFMKLNEEFYFRPGFITFNTDQGQFYSPTVGVSLRNIKAGKTRFSFYADYYPAHLAINDMLFAGGFGSTISIPLADIGNIKISSFINARETLLIKNSGLDSRTRITLGIGVESNE